MLLEMLLTFHREGAVGQIYAEALYGMTFQPKVDQPFYPPGERVTCVFNIQKCCS